MAWTAAACAGFALRNTAVWLFVDMFAFSPYWLVLLDNETLAVLT